MRRPGLAALRKSVGVVGESSRALQLENGEISSKVGGKTLSSMEESTKKLSRCGLSGGWVLVDVPRADSSSERETEALRAGVVVGSLACF